MAASQSPRALGSWRWPAEPRSSRSRLARRLGERGALVATDLNESMIAHPRARIPGSPRLTRREADGARLPFEDRAFRQPPRHGGGTIMERRPEALATSRSPWPGTSPRRSATTRFGAALRAHVFSGRHPD